MSNSKLRLSLYITEGGQVTPPRGKLTLAHSNHDYQPAVAAPGPASHALAPSPATGASVLDTDFWSQRHNPASRAGGSSSVSTAASAASPGTPGQVHEYSSPADRLRVSALAALAENHTRHQFEGNNVLAFEDRRGLATEAQLIASIHPLAVNFCHWLEEAYQTFVDCVDQSKLVPVWVEHLPEQLVIDQALLMLQQRGWLVVAPTPVFAGKRSGTVRMKLRTF